MKECVEKSIKRIVLLSCFCVLIFSLNKIYSAEDLPPKQIQIFKDFRQVTAAMKGQEVKVQGEVLSYKQSAGEQLSNVITISDGFLTIPLTFFPSLDQSIPVEAKTIGSIIEVKGTVDLYANTVIVKVTEPGAFSIIGKNPHIQVQQTAVTGDQTVQAPPPPDMKNIPKIAINKIDQSTLGKWILIEGEVLGFTSPWSDKAPNKITLDDGTKSISIVYWSDVSSGLTRVPQRGDKMQIAGIAQIYRNEYQLRVSESKHVIFLNGSGVSSQAIQQSVQQQPPKQISQTIQTSQQSVQTAPMNTQPKSPAPVSNPFADMPSISSKTSNQSSSQTAQKPVYQEQTANKMAEISPVNSQQIVSISGITTSSKDKVVTIKGTIYGVKGASTSDSPYFIYINDGTGNITVAYWSDVATKLNSSQPLASGKQAQVTGTVNVHQGVVWIKLEAPENLKILQ